MSIQRVFLFRLVVNCSLLAAAGACNSDRATQPGDGKDPQIPLITTLLVSAPSTVNAQGQLHLSVGSSDDASYAYVSASPGSSSGATVSITNRTLGRRSGTAKSVEAAIEDGGFDPVRVAASAGDTLLIEFLSADRSDLLVGAAVVPRVRPPTIVRTNPRPGKKDVPLNARFEIVFSEPIDSASITPQNIRVINGGASVAGSLVQTDPFTVEFIPAELLRPKSSFQIVVGTGVRNVLGVALENEFNTNFESGTDSDVTSIGCSPDTECLAFVRDGSIFTSSVGNPETALVSDGLRPSWSPDGTRIAFTRPAHNELAPWQLCITNQRAETRCASDGLDGIVRGRPSWSPDGSMLAFSVFYFSCANPPCDPTVNAYHFSGLLILNTATMQVTSLQTPAVWSSSWSPDGSKIALAIFGAGTFGRGALATVNPDGSNFKYVAMSFGNYSVEEVAWSPDAKRLALAMNNETVCPWYCDTALGVVNADGSDLKVLDKAHTCFLDSSCRANEAYIWGAPEWAGNGDRVAYTVTTGECYVDERASCGSIVMAANVNDGQTSVLQAGGGFPSWRR